MLWPLVCLTCTSDYPTKNYGVVVIKNLFKKKKYHIVAKYEIARITLNNEIIITLYVCKDYIKHKFFFTRKSLKTITKIVFTLSRYPEQTISIF